MFFSYFCVSAPKIAPPSASGFVQNSTGGGENLRQTRPAGALTALNPEPTFAIICDNSCFLPVLTVESHQIASSMWAAAKFCLFTPITVSTGAMRALTHYNKRPRSIVRSLHQSRMSRAIDTESGAGVEGFFSDREHALEGMAVRQHEKEIMEEIKREQARESEPAEDSAAAHAEVQRARAEENKEAAKKILTQKSDVDKEAFERAKSQFSGSV